MWPFNRCKSISAHADHPRGRRPERRSPSKRPRRTFLSVEKLEDRATPATVAWTGGGVAYLGSPGEANNVVFSNGPWLAVHDDPNVGLAPVPPFILSSFLQSFNISLGVSAGVDVGEVTEVSLSASIGIGFSIMPIFIPGTAVGPPTVGMALGAQNLANNVESAIATALPQAGASVVPGALVPADGNVYFKVQAAGNLDSIDHYQLYQVAVDPGNTQAEQEYNDDHSPAGSNLIPSFGAVSPIVTGNLGDGTPDYFRFHADAGQRLIVMLDNNPDRNDSGQQITGTALSLWGPKVFPPFPPPPPIPQVEQKAVNLSTDQGNALSAFDAPVSGDYYVGVNGLGIGPGTKYRFVVLKVNAGNSRPESAAISVASTVPQSIPDNDPGGVSSALVVGATAGTGHITSLKVALNIAHTRDSDLSASLVGPDGTTVPLFNGVGGVGANFGDTTTDTTIDDGAGTPIGVGSAPFTGSFRPQGSLSAFDGMDPRGAWQLVVTDNATGEVGTLNHWSLSYTTDESGDSAAGATPLTASQFGNGAIGGGDTDFWSAPAHAGQLMFSFVDTQHATRNSPSNPLASIDSTLGVIGNDRTTGLGFADNGGPPGADPNAVQNAKKQFDNTGIGRLAQETTNRFDINVGLGTSGHQDDNNENTVDVHDINAFFNIKGGANIDTLIAGYGFTTFHGYVSPDVLIDNFTGPSDNTYYGGPDTDTILVQGLVGDDTFDIDFTTGPDDRSFSITEDGVTAVYHIPDRDVEAIVVQGLGGNDAVTIHGKVPDYLTSGITFQGGGGIDQLLLDTISPGDPLLYRKGADDNSGSITVGAQPPIAFEGVADRPTLPAANPLVVFPHDFFEYNDTRANATPIGAGSALNQVATIGEGGDQDWYKFVAQETGTLDFQVHFTQNPNLAGGGNLDMNVYDVAGDLIGSSQGFSDGERVTIPVVRNQVYYLQVVGATSDAINVYDFSAINVPAPTPFQVDLTDGSDTGRDNRDNVTRNSAPNLNVFLDDARLLEFLNLQMHPDMVDNGLHDGDFGVDVYDNGVRLGSAAFVGPTNSVPANHWVYHVTAGQLQEGSNFLTAAVWFQDRAIPPVTSRGDFSLPLPVVLDTTPPAPPPSEGLAAPVNTTNTGLTNNPLPAFNGIAEPGTIVRLFADRNGDGMVGGDEVLLGTAVASLVDGRWSITSTVSLNDPSLFSRDGKRALLTTAEDQAGNVSAPSPFAIFLDTQGPQVTNVAITNRPAYDLFKLKPNDGSPTPRIDSLTVSLRDLPGRDSGFPYVALDPTIASQTWRYVLRGDSSGIIPISQAVVTNSASMAGQVSTATVELRFAAPLPDDRYTLTVSSALVDPVGNALDGESNASQPTGSPQFPSGDSIAGGDFVARFTVDSRPEIGTMSAGRVFVDINGNGVFDPTGVNNDQTNRDLTFTYGLRQDLLFAGNFARAGATSASGFAKLGAYGQSNGSSGPWRFLLDFNGDGVPDLNISSGIQGSGWAPVAGNFAPGHPGDEVGLFNGGKWVLDSNGDNNLGSAGDLQVQGSMKGLPFVGDFDGDGLTDLATYNNGVFSFDLAANGLSGNADATINFGFVGSFEQPVAGDVNLDGVTDVGLFVPEGNAPPPSEASQWYLLVSTGNRVSGTVSTLNHAFSPAPLGTDLYYQFGQNNETPVLANFDPPVGTDGTPPAGTIAPLQPAGDPAGLVHVVALPGAPQSAALGTTPGTPLRVQVLDTLGNSVSGTSVTFAAPPTGAGGTFAGTATILTDGQGIATAPAFTANTTTGSYVVTATANDFGTGAAFGLTNTPATPVATTGQALPSSTQLRALPALAAGRQMTLTALVGGVAGPATGNVQFFDVFRGRVRFLGTATVNNGSASLQVVLSAGRHGFRAVYAGDGTYSGSRSVLSRFMVGRGRRPHVAVRRIPTDSLATELRVL
jgi:subtilisin-like proprotein convertase family protein